MEWLDRLVLIMDVISKASTNGAGVSELAAHTGLSKGTLHRTLRAMVDHELLFQIDATKKYRLGFRAMIWGGEFIKGQDPAELFSQYCDVLARQTKLYTYLCRYEAGQVYCIYTCQPEPVRQQYFVHVGQRMPLHCCASAKAILAFRAADEVEKILTQEKLQKYTEFTITSLDGQLVELARVRREKIAYCAEEMEAGVTALAVPILLADGKACFSIGLVGGSDYVLKQKALIVAALRATRDKAGAHADAANNLGTVNKFH